MPPARQRRSAGFTLVELTLVIVLMGILVALAAPSLAGYVRRTRVEGALNELTGDIAYTRTLAVRSGRPATLTVEPGGTAYKIESTHQETATTTATRVAKRVNLTSDYRGVTLTPATTVLTFNSRGLLTPPPGDPMIIMAQEGNSGAVLTVFQSGRALRDY